MRLAILLSGQPRNIQVAYDTLKEFYLDKHQCDFFIHTWFDSKFSSDVYGKMIDLFKPKKILVEEQVIFDKKGISDPNWKTTLQNLASMNYSIFMANQLKRVYEREQGIAYDFVMRMRTDLKIKRPIELEKIEPGKIALYKWTETGYDNIGYSDCFAIGPSNLMDEYADCYNHINHYLNTDTTYVIPDSKLRPEYVLRHHLATAKKVPVQHFWHGDHSDPSFYLIR